MWLPVGVDCVMHRRPSELRPRQGRDGAHRRVQARDREPPASRRAATPAVAAVLLAARGRKDDASTGGPPGDGISGGREALARGERRDVNGSPKVTLK